MCLWDRVNCDEEEEEEEEEEEQVILCLLLFLEEWLQRYMMSLIEVMIGALPFAGLLQLM